MKIFFALMASSFIFIFADVIAGKTIRTDGVVMDKVYTPESEYMTIETRTDPNGNLIQELVHHYDPASWKFIVQDNAADVVNVWCSQSSYYRTPIGTQIPIFTRHGHWTGWRYFNRTLEY